MLTRYRWFNIRLPKEVRGLSETLLQHPFTQVDTFGFARLKRDLHHPAIRFYWKTKVIVTTFDEDGNASYSDVVNINYYDFCILEIEGRQFIRVENPGRNLTNFFNVIESIVGLGFVCEPVTFSRFDPAQAFQKIDSIKLIGLKVTEVVLSDDLVSKMEFTSKEGMNLSELTVLNGSKYKIDTGVYELTHESARGQISISSAGLVKINGQLAPKLLFDLEAYLSSI